jgi:replication factor A1
MQVDWIEFYSKVKERVSFDEFEERVQKKIKAFGGLLDIQTASYLVAYEIGLDSSIKIKDIGENESNVTVTGVVTKILNVRDFERNGKQGKVANIILTDNTGTLNVVLWNEIAELIETKSLQEGDMIRVRGYTKAGSFGLELHVGKFGIVEILEKKREMYIKDLENDKTFTISGTVTEDPKIESIESDKVARFTIRDESGSIKINCWSDAVDRCRDLKPGDLVQVKIHVKGGEGHVENSNDITIKGIPDREVELTKIADIVPRRVVNIKGEVSGMERVREFTTKDGRLGRVGHIYLSDETGRVRVVLWNERTNIIQDIDIGTPILIINGFSKLGYDGLLEVHVNWKTQIEIMP